MWPKYVDMSDNECKLMLRKLELEAYSNMVSALRAQGPLTDEKQGLLMDIASELHIPRERYSAEIRRAVNDEKLSTIALQIYGPNTEIKWAIEGRREIPLIPRLHAQTAYSFLADKIANITATENAKIPLPTKANRKEVQPTKKSDVHESRSTKKSQQESKVLAGENEEEKPKEISVKIVTLNKSNEKNDGRVCMKSPSERIESKTSPSEKISHREHVENSISIARSDESSSVKRRKVIAKTNFSKPIATVVPKNVKNGKALITAKAASSNVAKPPQIISAVKPATSTTGAKMVAMSSSIHLSSLKVVNKNVNSPFSSSSSFPYSTSNSVVTGIKVMTPRSSVAAAVPRTTPASIPRATTASVPRPSPAVVPRTDLPRFMRPNLSSVRPNVTNSLAGVRHNVVVMQKNSHLKRGVTISSKELADKMLKRKPSSNISSYSGSTISKVPKLSQEGSQNTPTTQGNIMVVGVGQGNSSSPFPASSKHTSEIASVTYGTNLGNNVKTYTKSKFIYAPDIPKSVVVTSCIGSTKVISSSASSEVKTLLPKHASSTTVLSTESKPTSTSNSTKVIRVQQDPSISDKPLSVANRLLTSSTSASSFSDSISVMPSTKIIITDNEGKIIGTVPSASIASSQSQLNLLFSMPSASSTTNSTAVASRSFPVSGNSNHEPVNIMKSVVVPSSSRSNFSNVSCTMSNLSTNVPEKSSSQSNIFMSREKLVSSSSVYDKPIVSPKIQSSESSFVVEHEPIIVNVPSSSDIECVGSSFISNCNTSDLSQVNEVLVDLNETEFEDVGVLDPVTGIYSFPFDENESNQDSTVSVNSLPSSTDFADQLECNLSSQILSVSPVLESATDASLSHIIVESSEVKMNSTELNESSASSETINECDISNISVTEVTLEETLECFESAAHGLYTEEIVGKDPQNIDGVLDNL